MDDWQSIENLPDFHKNNKTVYVEIMLKDGRKDTAFFGKNPDGTIYCDTGYMIIEMADITKWRPLWLY